MISAGSSVTVVHRDHPAFNTGDTYTIWRQDDGPDESIFFPTGTAYNTDDRIQLNNGDTVRVVWESPDGTETAVLFEQTRQY